MAAFGEHGVVIAQPEYPAGPLHVITGCELPQCSNQVIHGFHPPVGWSQQIGADRLGAETDKMGVPVDEPGNDGTPGQVTDPGLIAPQGHDLRFLAYGNNETAPDCDRLGHGPRIVHRDDGPVTKNPVGHREPV